MPVWPHGTATCFQLYETVTEGTPTSPVFETVEGLAQWCEDSRLPYTGDDPAYRTVWLAEFRDQACG